MRETIQVNYRLYSVDDLQAMLESPRTLAPYHKRALGALIASSLSHQKAAQSLGRSLPAFRSTIYEAVMRWDKQPCQGRHFNLHTTKNES